MGRIFPLLATITLAGAAASPGAADSFAPVGLWRGESSGDFLLVWGEGFCATGGSVTIAGPCTWTPRDHSGQLSMRAERTAGPSNLDLSVEWLDQNTILVNGTERYERKG